MSLTSLTAKRPLPTQTGIGLRAEHYQDVIEQQPNIPWFEVHSENYFGQGGKPHFYLEKIRENYPLSLHGVGLSLASSDDFNQEHLKKLKQLIQRYKPFLVSEHLCWSSINNFYLNDLLPFFYNEETLEYLIQRINTVQEYLDRQILVENITCYLQFKQSTIPESEFITEIAKRTGCGILLDVNNLYVNSQNHGWDCQKYLAALPKELIQEIHLAGYSENIIGDDKVLIDSHDHPVHQGVWDLYRQTIESFGAIPTLIEWDKSIPKIQVLMREAEKANQILEQQHAVIA